MFGFSEFMCYCSSWSSDAWSSHIFGARFNLIRTFSKIDCSSCFARNSDDSDIFIEDDAA
jgi:hypothetical protein